MTPLQNDPQQHWSRDGGRQTSKHPWVRVRSPKPNPAASCSHCCAFWWGERLGNSILDFCCGHHEGGTKVDMGLAELDPAYNRQIVENPLSLELLGETRRTFSLSHGPNLSPDSESSREMQQKSRLGHLVRMHSLSQLSHTHTHLERCPSVG
jgi:hypothetical protein